MTDLATTAPAPVTSNRPDTLDTDGVAGLWLVLVTAACAFGVLGLTRSPSLFVAMAAIAAGSLMMGRASMSVEAHTRRSLRLLQTLGMVCCVTVLLNLFS
ncbi:MAG: hypothetical protein HY828_16820 [Actinobacteria bacterium]|nr:hypothetical protein [Actinomycetota bacterium]